MARKTELKIKDPIKEGQIRVFNPKKGFRAEIRSIQKDEKGNPIYVNVKFLEAPLEYSNFVGSIKTMLYKDAMGKVI